jgi:hypothetical protein
LLSSAEDRQPPQTGTPHEGLFKSGFSPLQVLGIAWTSHDCRFITAELSRDERVTRLVLVLVIVLGCSARSWAQDDASTQQPPLTPRELEQRYLELSAWMKQYRNWERFYESYGNRLAHGPGGGMDLARVPRPDPPAWLAADCEMFAGSEGLWHDACAIVRQWDDLPLLILKRSRTARVAASGIVNDKVVKTSFLQRIHLTGLWVPAQYPTPPFYGIVGMQLGLVQIKRLTFPAIGTMVVRMPDGYGGHTLKPATTLAAGVRLFDFAAPFVDRRATLHFNIARAQLHGVGNDPALQTTLGLNFMGFSISFK